MQLTISSCANNPSPQYNDSANNKTYILNTGDTLQFPIDVKDPNNDSVYFTYSGTVFNGSTTINPPYASLSEGNGSGKAEYHSSFFWVTNCNSKAPDTEYVYLVTADNGCPIHKISTSRIKIVVQPAPTPIPPQVLCLDRIDTNTLRINFGQLDMNKYFAYYLLIRVNPDSSKTILTKITREYGKTYFVDNTAYNNMNLFYKYYFVGVNVCGDTGVPSYKVYSDPKYPREPTSRYIFRSTVVNKKILIQWQKAPEEDFLSYVLYKKSDTKGDSMGPFMTFKNKLDTSFIDSAVDVDHHSYCYQLIAASKCGYVSKLGNRACTILLQGSSEPFESHLEWSPYYAWKGGVSHYTIGRRDPAVSSDSIDYVISPTITYIDDKLDIDWGIYWYTVTAHEGPNGFNATSTSNELQLIQKPIVYAPNAFTPNSDSLNDNWGIVPVFVKEFNLKVYNRWGEKVFEASDKHHHWDGNFIGKDNFDNVFIYQLMYTGWDGSIHYMKGNVTTIK